MYVGGFMADSKWAWPMACWLAGGRRRPANQRWLWRDFVLSHQLSDRQSRDDVNRTKCRVWRRVTSLWCPARREFSRRMTSPATPVTTRCQGNTSRKRRGGALTLTLTFIFDLTFDNTSRKWDTCTTPTSRVNNRHLNSFCRFPNYYNFSRWLVCLLTKTNTVLKNTLQMLVMWCDSLIIFWLYRVAQKSRPKPLWLLVIIRIKTHHYG